MPNYFKGIDVSSVQQNVNYNQLIDLDIKFVIAKSFTGNDGSDPFYKQNINNAKLAGMKVAAYNFIYPLRTNSLHPNRDAEGQANLHFQKTGGDIITCVDLEWPAPQDFDKWMINGNFIKDWTLKYLERYEELSGRKCIVYTYPFFAKAINLGASPEFANYSLWIASYQSGSPSIPSPWNDWTIWQDSGGDKMKLPNGIPVDTDMCKDLSIFDLNPVAVTQQPTEIPSVNTQQDIQPTTAAETPPVSSTNAPQSTSTLQKVEGAISNTDPQTVNSIIKVIMQVINFIVGLFKR